MSMPSHGLFIGGGSTKDTSGELQVFEKLPFEPRNSELGMEMDLEL